MQSGCIIVGAGAVGSALGWILEQAGVPCFFWGRKGPIRYQTSILVEKEQYRVDFGLPPADFAPEAVLVTVKAYDVEKALSHEYLLAKPVPIIILCNGIVEDEVRNLARTHNNPLWRRGVVMMGVKAEEGGGWELVSQRREVVWGPLKSGALPTSFEVKLLKQFTEKGWRWQDDIAPVVRRKWLFNTCLNSLCAFYKLPTNLSVLQHKADLRTMFDEAYALGQELWGEWVVGKEPLYQELLAVIQNTGGNENSMARDARLGRPTENRFLAGLVTKGKKSYPLLRTVFTVLAKQSPDVKFS